MLLQNVSLNDQIGHLYVVDIKFDHTKATEKQIVYNEIYPPIIEVYHLLQQNSATEKGNRRTYRAAHAMLFKINK